MKPAISSLNEFIIIDEALNENESIINYQLYQFYPVTGTQLNNPGNITITVNNSDNFYHLAYSWLEFEGQVVKKTAGTAYAKADLISLVNCENLYIMNNLSK